MALMLEVSGQRKRGRQKQTWRRQFEETVKRIEAEEAANRARWRKIMREIVEGLKCIRSQGKTRIKIG